MNKYHLHMSPTGVHDLLDDLSFRIEKGKPQVYIHVGASEPLYHQVIRIGQAKNGAFDRWKSSSGHCKTFLYAIGAEEGYSRPWLYPDYLAFFAGLNDLDTYLYVITCESPQSMHALEKRLIKQTFGPIWEQYRPAIKGRRGYFQRHPEVGGEFAQFGVALRQLERQRAGDGNLPEPLPDVLAFQSENQWSVERTNQVAKGFIQNDAR